MREIISIQVGGYANFVGSHFWNLQDEILGLQNDKGGTSWFSNTGVNLDILYRIGETRQGLATYTPRLLAIDARGSLGSVKATGSLYEQPLSSDVDAVASWKGKVVKHVSEPCIKNMFLQSLEQEELEWNLEPEENVTRNCSVQSTNHDIRDDNNVLHHLDEKVHFWTDYSKVHFHPLSLLQLEGVWAETTPFDDYGYGKGIFSGYTEEEILDRLHFFVEEADCMQGLQVLLDDSNGFAAVSSELLEAVNDEYAKSPVLLFMVRPPSSLKKPSSVYESTVRNLHDAISFSALKSASSHIFPLGLSSFAKMSRYLHVDEEKNFHTSAVYAAALSCMSLPLRMHTSEGGIFASEVYGGMDMGTLAHLLSGQRCRQVSASELAMPAPPIQGAGGNQALESSKFHSLLEGVTTSDEWDASEVFVIQGASFVDSPVPASLQDVVTFFGRKERRFSQLSASTCPLPIPLPFPNLFGSSRGGDSGVSSISIATKTSTGVSVLPYLEKRFLSLQQQARGSLGSQILEGWGLQKDDIKELCESMSSVIAPYKDGMTESASDSE